MFGDGRVKRAILVTYAGRYRYERRILIGKSNSITKARLVESHHHVSLIPHRGSADAPNRGGAREPSELPD